MWLQNEQICQPSPPSFGEPFLTSEKGSSVGLTPGQGLDPSRGNPIPGLPGKILSIQSGWV